MATKYKEGDDVKCSFRSVFYPAKILKVDHAKGDEAYLVHYQGWKKRWDEWVPLTRFQTLKTAESLVKKSLSTKKANLFVESTFKKQPSTKKTKIIVDSPVKKSLSKKKEKLLSSEKEEKEKSEKKSVDDSAAETLTAGPSSAAASSSSSSSLTSSLIPQTRKRGRPPKLSLISKESSLKIKTTPAKHTKLVLTKKSSPKKAKLVLPSGASDASPQQLTTKIFEGVHLIRLEERRSPNLKRVVRNNVVIFQSLDGRTFNTLDEIRDYCTMKNYKFDESIYDFSIQASAVAKAKSALSLSKLTRNALIATKQTKKRKYEKKPKIMSPSISKVYEGSHIKRGRGRPPKMTKLLLMSDFPQPKQRQVDLGEEKTAGEQLELSLAAAAQDLEHAGKSTVAKKLIQPIHDVAEMPESSDRLEFFANPSQSSSNRPARHRKPNQRFNVLISEMDALVRQEGRRRRYSSKHSTTSGDEMFPDEPLTVKLSPKEKKNKKALLEGAALLRMKPPKDAKDRKKKVDKEKKRAMTSSSSMEYEQQKSATPEFVEIQARNQSPQEIDDGLPPVLGTSGHHDDSLRPHSRETTLPLVDQMCAALNASQSPPNTSHTMNQFESNMQGYSSISNELHGSGDGQKKRARKPNAKKAKHFAGNEGDHFESAIMEPTPQLSPVFPPKPRRKKEKKTPVGLLPDHHSPPMITNQEIEEGLHTLEAMEALQGIKVLSSGGAMGTGGLTIATRPPPTQFVIRPKPEPVRGARSRKNASEIPKLHRESDPNTSSEFEGLTIVSRQPAAVGVEPKFCYLPPEIMGDHCYGKSQPIAPSAANYSAGPTLEAATTQEMVYGGSQSTEESSAPPALSRAVRGGRPTRYEVMHTSPSPPPYKQSSAFLSDAVNAYSFHRLDADYENATNSGEPTSVPMQASMMSGGQVALLSDKLPANILEEDDGLEDEVTSVDIQ